MHASGRGVVKDEAKAAGLLRKAADQGRASAQCNLGAMYADGEGVVKDEAKAAALCTKAADRGHADAQYSLGAMYASGRGVVKNKAKAARWLRKATDQGHTEAQYVLGVMYASGEGVVKDEAKAAGLLWNSANDYDLVPISGADAHGLQHGDALVGKFSVAGVPCEHWGIYDKDKDEVIELGGTRKQKGGSLPQQIKGGTAWSFTGSGSSAFSFGSGHFASIHVIPPQTFFDNYPQNVHCVQWKVERRSYASGAVQRARARVGEHPLYALFPKFGDKKHENCESFVRECYTGTRSASQTTTAQTDPGGNSLAQFIQSMLAW
jgi:hypothetical protein